MEFGWQTLVHGEPGVTRRASILPIKVNVDRSRLGSIGEMLSHWSIE